MKNIRLIILLFGIILSLGLFWYFKNKTVPSDAIQLNESALKNLEIVQDSLDAAQTRIMGMMASVRQEQSNLQEISEHTVIRSNNKIDSLKRRIEKEEENFEKLRRALKDFEK